MREGEDQKEQVDKETGRPKEPLERHSTGALRLAAILSEMAVPKAMFIDPSGVGHLAKEGDGIGTNGGTIEDIRSNEVVIALPTGGGRGSTTEKVIKLREAEQAITAQTDLDNEQRRMLDQLLRSEEGRKALRESYRKVAPGANEAEQQRRRQREGSQGDQRFPGLAPPSEQ